MGKRRNAEEEPAPEIANRRELFDEYHSRINAFFRSRGFSPDEVLDLTQETFVRVFQNMGKLRSRSRASLDSWILRIAVNVWKNEIRYRRAGKRDAVEVPLDSGDTSVEVAEAALKAKEVPSPLEEALSSERLAAVAKCLEALPPRMRRCLVLHVFQERKYQEIGDLLELSIQSVKSHIHQARQRLGECVARRLAGEGR